MIEVFFEDVNEIPGVNPEFFVEWPAKVCEKEGKVLEEVSLIFVSDDYLLDMNQRHLNHDYYTDIITFDYCEDDKVLGDLFISIDRVRDNAKQLGVSEVLELNRVVAHGVLHLCGYKDKTKEEEAQMRLKENEALEMIVSRETL